jgi:hypothetical protein
LGFVGTRHGVGRLVRHLSSRWGSRLVQDVGR